ncbi:hypothetical protein CPB84DRAFT_1783219 [Gymnopilus junonius]|uniref:Amidohydrolase-related domain-containing protein n=1 Tax=Gymnopilus junonius TaxID=109634 RepID=A0A9P5NMI5_GYMJU|nr:hypothetical protein CPB84DRAFT_1783219 [Gymnopilus junonius]
MTSSRSYPPQVPGTPSTTASIATVTSRNKRLYQILAGQLFDSVNRTLAIKQVITIDRDAGVILDVSGQSDGKSVGKILAGLGWKLNSNGNAEKGDKIAYVEVTRINLASLVLLPGFVDVHVHLFLHPYSESPWEYQVMKESLAERTVRATLHARKTLMAGFTTVRDLGTEGAFDADIALRKCISGKKALIPGPRYYCATRAIISSGSYGPRSSLYPHQQGIDGVNGAEPVDGIAECVKEVRKQIGAGADWIKIYADYSVRTRMVDISFAISSRSIGTFSKEELSAMITEAHDRGVKVAAHANTPGVIDILLDLGVDTIEHGPDMYDALSGDRSLLHKFARANGTTTWVPTLAVHYISALSGSDFSKKRWEKSKKTFEEAIQMRVKRPDVGDQEMENIACGGDTGTFKHGDNALELVLMRRLGADWDRVLGWATYGGWKCVRGAEWEGEEGGRRVKAFETLGFLNEDEDTDLERGVPFGALRAGWAADLVGIEGKLDGSPQEFEDALMNGVKFVMRGGFIYKKDGMGVADI